jgi:hypothetical protein
VRKRFGVGLLGALTAGLAVGVVVAATPAWAHVQVSADKPQAGATNVTVSFSGEAESPTSGIKSEQIFLPDGITPDMVTLVSAPTGWTLTKSTNNVTIAGKALPKGTDAKYSIRITKLPSDATELVFKTIETYGNGDIDRWIELQKPGQAEPDHPAPALKLRPAAAAPTTTAAQPTTASPTGPSATTTAAAAGSNSGNSNVWIIVLVVAVIAIGAGAAVLIRRRRPNPPAA